MSRSFLVITCKYEAGTLSAAMCKDSHTGKICKYFGVDKTFVKKTLIANIVCQIISSLTHSLVFLQVTKCYFKIDKNILKNTCTQLYAAGLVFLWYFYFTILCTIYIFYATLRYKLIRRPCSNRTNGLLHC